MASHAGGDLPDRQVAASAGTVAAANREAVARLHAAPPPVPWAEVCEPLWAAILGGVRLEFEGALTGIDMRRAVSTGIAAIIKTGIAHRPAGVGQMAAGVVRAPTACFVGALRALVETEGAACEGEGDGVA